MKQFTFPRQRKLYYSPNQNDRDMSMQSFAQYYGIITELQQNNIPILPSFVNHSQNLPWLPIMREVFQREIINTTDSQTDIQEAELSQILSNRVINSHREVFSSKRLRERISLKENCKAIKKFRHSSHRKGQNFSMPHTFWLKILDKSLMEIKTSPQSSKSFMLAQKKILENWFSLLNPLYKDRLSHIQLINNHSNKPRRKSADSYLLSRKIRLMLNLSLAKQLPKIKLPDMKFIQVTPASPSNRVGNLRRQTKPSNEQSNRKIDNYQRQQEKYLLSFAFKIPAVSRPTSVKVKNDPSKNMKTMKFLNLQNASSNYISFPSELSIQQRIDSRDLIKTGSNILEVNDAGQSKNSMGSIITPSSVSEQNTPFKRFTNPLYRVYDTDLFQQEKLENYNQYFKSTSEERFRQKNFNLRKNIESINSPVKNKKKKKSRKNKLVRSTSKTNRKEDLSLIQTYFPGIKQIDDFKRKIF